MLKNDSRRCRQLVLPLPDVNISAIFTFPLHTPDLGDLVETAPTVSSTSIVSM
jgi:hypothetical protein